MLMKIDLGKQRLIKKLNLLGFGIYIIWMRLSFGSKLEITANAESREFDENLYLRDSCLIKKSYGIERASLFK